MPSYRVTLAVGALATGVAPDAVLPAAARSAAELTVVEAQDVRLLRGVPCAVVRYEAAEDAEAVTVARHVVEGLRDIVEVRSDRVTRRDGARWTPIA